MSDLGKLLVRRGDLDAAERHLRAALAKEPAHRGATHGLAVVMLLRDDAAAAIVLVEKLLRDRPDDHGVRNTYARCLLTAGRNDDALKAFRRALAGRPDDAQFQRDLVVGLLASDRHDDAIEAMGAFVDARAKAVTDPQGGAASAARAVLAGWLADPALTEPGDEAGGLPPDVRVRWKRMLERARQGLGANR